MFVLNFKPKRNQTAREQKSSILASRIVFFPIYSRSARIEVKNNVYSGSIANTTVGIWQRNTASLGMQLQVPQFRSSHFLKKKNIIIIIKKKPLEKQGLTNPATHFKRLLSPAYLPCSFPSADRSQKIESYTYLSTEYSFKPLTTVDLI